MRFSLYPARRAPAIGSPTGHHLIGKGASPASRQKLLLASVPREKLHRSTHRHAALRKNPQFWMPVRTAPAREFTDSWLRLRGGAKAPGSGCAQWFEDASIDLGFIRQPTTMSVGSVIAGGFILAKEAQPPRRRHVTISVENVIVGTIGLRSTMATGLSSLAASSKMDLRPAARVSVSGNGEINVCIGLSRPIGRSQHLVQPRLIDSKARHVV